MHNSQNKKTLQIVLLVVIAVVTLGIGYAAISAVNLIINGNATASVDQNNFKVHFIQAQAISGSTGASGTSSIDSEDDTKATFDVTGLTKVGDYAEAVYTVRNDSNGIGAEIALNLTSSNTEYFKVTETILDNKLQAGEETTAKVRVEMIKTPITDAVSTTITATLTASPLEDAEATGSSSASIEKPTAFERDSWTTIKTNVQNGNTSQYNIGDTKEILIDVDGDGISESYTVRIANKSIPKECNNEGFSQTACGFVVEFTDVVELRTFNSTGTNSGDWPGSELHNYLQENFYQKFSDEVKNSIIDTYVVSGNNSNQQLYTSFDKIYLMSIKELYNINGSELNSVGLLTRQLDYYASKNIIYSTTNFYEDSTNIVYVLKKYKGNNNKYWLRTSIYGCAFNYVDNDGMLKYNCAQLDGFGVAPAFRIG